MSEIIFVNLFDDEGKYYHSYKEEFWALVTLSQFKSCTFGEIDYSSDNTYICFLRNGDTEANFSAHRERNCKLVLWLQEWGKWDDNGELDDGFNLQSYWDEVWVSDRYFKVLLEKKNPRARVRYVFFGGHPDFGGHPEDPKIWDFVHLSYAYGTRAHKMQILHDNGYSFAPEAYSFQEKTPTKNETLAHSKWGLALQQFNTPFVNHQRWTLFSSWRLPILCDFVVDPFPYKAFPEGLIHFDPKSTICNNKVMMDQAVDYNHHLVTTMTFKRSVEDADKGIITL